jgi:AcrR family transcriptional regulator
MKARLERAPSRRRPRQQRARQTVDAILAAVERVLKRRGLEGVTTNRIAEAADKRAIFTALHDRHVETIARLIDRTLVEQAAAPLEDFVRALVEALVDAHAADPELHRLMAGIVPHGTDGGRALEVRLRTTFKLAIGARSRGGDWPPDLDKALFVLPHLVEALAHGAAYGRPPNLSVTAAKAEAVRAVLAYLRS